MSPQLELSLLPQDRSVASGAEWQAQGEGWLLLQVRSGAGYWTDASGTVELQAGDLMVVQNPAAGGHFLASRAVPVASVRTVFVPMTLVRGVVPVEEGLRLEAELRARPWAQRFGGDTSAAARFSALAAETSANPAQSRFGWLAFWAERVDLRAGPLPARTETGEAEAKFRELLEKTTPTALAGLSPAKLAGLCACSPRHFARLFAAKFRRSFRQWRAEVRLDRASQLLKNSDGKVITIAHECGYQNLGLFNRMFKRRFGATPTEYRAQRRARRPARVSRSVAIGLLAMGCCRAAWSQAAPASPPPRTNAPPRFAVRGYQVEGNSLLSEQAVQNSLNSYTGPAVELQTIRQAVAALTGA